MCNKKLKKNLFTQKIKKVEKYCVKYTKGLKRYEV